MKQFDRADAERLVQTYSDLILRLAYTYLTVRRTKKRGSSARPPTPARTACAPRTGAMSVWKPLPRHPRLPHRIPMCSMR